MNLKKNAREAYFNGNHILSKKICKEVLSYIDSIDDNSECIIKLHSKILERLFYIEKNANKYSEALSYLKANKVLRKKFPDFFSPYNYSIKLQEATIYSFLGEWKKSNEILYQMLKDKKEFNYKVNGLVHIHNLIYQNYLHSYKGKNNKVLDSAQKYLIKSFKNQEKLNGKNHNKTIVFFYTHRGILEIKRGQFKKAISFLDSAKVINKSTKATDGNQIELNLSHCYQRIKKPKLAIYHAYNFLSSRKNKNIFDIRKLEAFNILSKQYQILKKNDSAYKYATLALKQIKESKKVNEIGLKALSKKNIEEVKNENQKIINHKDNTFYLTLTFLTTLLIATSLLIYKYSLIKHREKKYLNIISELKKNTSKTAPNTTKPELLNDNIVKEIMNGLNELEKNNAYLKSDFTMHEVAKILKTNTSYLSKVVNHFKGSNFKEYVNKLRMEYIINQIIKDEQIQKYSIEAIAKEIGFSNASTFSKAFKKYNGISPSYYIKKVISDKENK